MGSIQINNLGKAYKQYPSHWARLAEWMLPYANKKHQLHWVLQDINFAVAPGEAVGIIGINGAGKSTLLKMIVGTTLPTTGSVLLTGHVAALLELGMGFHPDFSGRQNACMAGMLLGLTGQEIDRLMPEIEAFAEIGEYIDQPVRVYSSGMQMRLAFSVATARRPDILVVDEALSVGDAYFQHKSSDRIREFRKLGTTLLIVSHDKSAIQSLCDRAILLDSGRIAKEGGPEEIMDFYNAMLADRENQGINQKELENGRIQTISGTGEATVESIVLLNDKGEKVEVIDVGQQVTLNIVVKIKENIDRLVLGYGIKDRLGQVMYGTNTDLKKQVLHNLKAGESINYDIHFPANLGPGSYSVQTALVSTDTHLVNNYEWHDLALIFNVVNMHKEHFAGCAWIDPEIKISRK